MNVDFVFVIGCAVVLSLLIPVIQYMSRRRFSREQEFVKKEIDSTLKTLHEEPQDAISMMRRNVAELKGYYIITRQQASNAFTSALVACFLGFLIFAAGLLVIYLSPDKSDIIPYSTIAGVVVEVISGLFFWLYSRALKQINIFHKQLDESQQFLTAIQVTANISREKRDEIYEKIINNLISGKGEVKNNSP
ncbi:hypothetical protein A2Y85_03090 [candidate division WOR-3 bacterium RBG_13_43_14]|uniref:Cyanobacterial TRADD-N associated 2 transmembrane domain-containing protein n=1 Tax=candidate division WOR-3 bacterium RBG_13_43_14 TaxID=1802590 RepID=A0A1F4UDK0_UNCW3|nr:MAG: hypothetical protein A2Y85_03090 [candidate division WOR-3 bacterium RBG_13_43_14]